ncbi:hypothetical protein IKG10_03185 [Candidatus Saccharibacteria bacterium]|nr:hypothetical protein [Candidatus Saccharibacteria bacterium]
MKKGINNKTKKGAASFYMVAFSTLILIIIVTSFAAVIISEVARTANDDLSQSAYDSALAGIEDAKILINNYRKCISENSADDWCTSIKNYIEAKDNNTSEDCDQVGILLGRIKQGDNGVPIQESNVSNNMSQSYTCVKIGFPGNYISTLSPSAQAKVVKTKFENATITDKVQKVKISWFSDSNTNKEIQYNYSNFDKNAKEVKFPDDSLGIPPTISISMIQTAEEFRLDDFTTTNQPNGTTDRGTLFLVPTNNEEAASNNSDDSTYKATEYDKAKHTSIIEKNSFIESNNQNARNLPYAVYCEPDSDTDFACSALIDIPRPVGGGSRNPDTFVFVVTLPYGGPDTDFELEFMCDDGENCNPEATEESTPEEKQIAKLDGVQIKVDSTGRANDMYRRVEVRLEGDSDYPLSILGPLELLKGEAGNDSSFVKDLSPTMEHDFLDN